MMVKDYLISEERKARGNFEHIVHLIKLFKELGWSFRDFFIGFEEMVMTVRKNLREDTPIQESRDVNVFMCFVAFVVEATGRLSSDALCLVKLAYAESKNPLLLHDFVTQVGGAIARYNAMAAQAWVHHCFHLSANLAIGGG